MGNTFEKAFEPLAKPLRAFVNGLAHFVTALVSEIPDIINAFKTLAHALEELVKQAAVLWAAASVMLDWCIFLTPAALALYLWGQVTAMMQEMHDTLQWTQQQLDWVNAVQTVFLGAVTARCYQLVLQSND
jgi:hypothetical protein